MKDQLIELLKLQELDTKIDELEVIKTDIPMRLDNQRLNVQFALDEVSKAKKQLEEAQKNKKLQELEMESKNEEIKKLQNHLYSVKDNKQYSAILQEINFVKESVSVLEEEIIQKLFVEDNIRKNINTSQENFKKEEANLKDLENQCNEEIKKVEEQLNQLKSKREEIARKINHNILSTYNNIREKIGGIGISEVIDSSCRGCNIGLRPQMIIEIKKYENLIFCESCGRILCAK